MKGYKFVIWCETPYGTNTNVPDEIVHANNIEEAEKKFKKQRPLKEGYFVYKIILLGLVRKRVKTWFEYIPIKKRKYERNVKDY